MTRRAIFYTSDRNGHQPTFGGAFVEGLRRHGWQAEVSNEVRPCDLFILWGARRRHLMERARRVGAEICVLERGYVGDRFAWTSVSFGGLLNGRAQFRGPVEDPRRWELYFPHALRPWRAGGGEYALIMEQVPGDTAVEGVNLPEFYNRAEAAYRWLMPVRRRAHPRLTPGHGAEVIAAARRSLDEDLAGAALVVTWNSNSAVDAVLAGVPTVAMDPGSMAWAVTGHELTLPPSPDRTAWAHRLAWCQWRREELADGTCWEAVGRELIAERGAA